MFRRREPVPPELAFLSDDEWRELARLVDDAARRFGGKRDGSVVRFAADKRLNLGNLARACHDQPRETWPAEVDRFASLFERGVDPLEVIRADPVAARRQLRVRPYPAEALRDIPFGLVSRPLAGELVDVVCLDFPDQVIVLNEDMAAALGAGDDELLTVGLENVRGEGQPEHLERVRVDEGVDVDVFVSESFYTATWGRWADELMGGLEEHGALVVMPTRYQVAVHPLRTGRGAAVAPGRLLLFAELGVSDGVGPISAQLFWWRHGRLSHLLGAMTDGEIHFSPSDDYLATMEALLATSPD